MMHSNAIQAMSTAVGVGLVVVVWLVGGKGALGWCTHAPRKHRKYCYTHYWGGG